MQTDLIFGYGSLVNRATHDFANTHVARLNGWRRCFRGTRLREVAFLSIEPAPGHAIDGLVAEVPAQGRAALDARERAYAPVPLPGLQHGAGDRLDASAYRLAAHHISPPGAHHPILLSYVDVVLQGYLHLFGAVGAADFMATTDGWDLGVINDRAAPRYPRHQALSAPERALVDRLLVRHRVRILPG